MNQACVPEQSETGGFVASDAGWAFAGALTLDGAAAVLATSRSLPLPPTGVLDFSDMMHADSAALAVIIALKRRAATEGVTLSIVGLPASLHSLAVVYGVENLLG